MVTSLLGGHGHHHGPIRSDGNRRTRSVSHQSDTQNQQPSEVQQEHQNPENPAAVACPCCSEDPVADLDNIRNMADEMEAKEKGEPSPNDDLQPVVEEGKCCDDSQCGAEECKEADEEDREDHTNHDERKLMRMSINTAIAIGLHNFPEGLATFVATLSDPAIGGVLAIAIAIHNIPEGLCVAMPIYYATGNRWKAFGYALLSGVAEPIAALLGWAVLANSFSDRLYGILFGLVAGMMIIISARELLPTAHRYDPEDTVVTYSFIGGMGIMAISLVLFII